MKIIITGALFITSFSAIAQEQKADSSALAPVEVSAVRAAEKIPVAKTNLSKKEIEKLNIGQDLPFILNNTPSVTVSSDAGNGVGYTYMKIRGTDASRINVTLNGIPYNDAESQGTFFVDLPDFSSSAGSIQIQRGVGTSTNGAGAFGGSVNLSTNELVTKRNIELSNLYGSYNTVKNTLNFNSGLFGKYFTFDGRLSHISSDGYIDRAYSKLFSFYTSSAFIKGKNTLRLNIFSGREKTYQAWNGVDEATLKTNRRFNSAGNEKPGEPYGNEIDNYTQTHYQLFFTHRVNNFWRANIAAFLTRGKGYYEQYKADRKLSSIGLPDYISGTTTIKRTDWVRRLWLDNYFYGTTFSAIHDKNKTQLTIGGAYALYNGQHYGRIVWAKDQAAVPANYEWYRHRADKNDFNSYAKWVQRLDNNWSTFVDLQYRAVSYKADGFRDNPTVKIDQQYNFLNPKAGVTYSLGNDKIYFSYGRATKEPNRDDFEAGATQLPKPEKLTDLELGWERKNTNSFFGINLYHMLYKNQLILTGKINDVGAYTRMNIDKSYRTGVELQAAGKVNKYLRASANLTFSSNKIKNFPEYIDDYDNGGQVVKLFPQTDISYSPNVIGNAIIDILPYKNFEINLFSKYVGKQYLDNTTNNSRKLNPYFLQDARVSYTLAGKAIKEAKLFVQVNNIFNKKYEPNGYTFSYINGGVLNTENYYFPMAPMNWMLGLNLKF